MARCSTTKKNLGVSRCNDLPKQIRGMLSTPSDFKLTPEEAADVTAWQDALLAPKTNRVYKYPSFISGEDAKTDVAYEENTLGVREADRGRYQWRFSIAQDMCTHRALVTHSGPNQRVILFDGNQYFMMEDEEGNLMGFPAYINVEKMIIGDGSTTTKTPIFVSLVDAYDVDNWGVTIPAKFNSSLQPLTDVELSVVPKSADEIVVAVAAVCDGVEVSGLAMADFQVRTVAGVLQALDSATEDPDTPGQYTLEGTLPFVSGTITLRAASALTVKGYEAAAPVTFTIP